MINGMALTLYIFSYTIQLDVINETHMVEIERSTNNSKSKISERIQNSEFHYNRLKAYSTSIVNSTKELENIEYNLQLLIYYIFPSFEALKLHKRTLSPSRHVALNQFNLCFSEFKFIDFENLNWEECKAIIEYNESIFKSNKQFYVSLLKKFLQQHILVDLGYTTIPGKNFENIEHNKTLKGINFLGNKNLESFTRSIFLDWYNMFNYVTTNTIDNSMIPLKYPFMIPGEEFNEMYYWDTYFQIDTLLQFELFEFIFHLLNNFMDLLDMYTFIPNATRTYFDRTQPPVFGLIIDKVFSSSKYTYFPDKLRLLKDRCISQLELEYEFWMNNRIVEVEGFPLNIYKNESNKPRLEQIGKDFQCYLKYKSTDIFNEIKSATESGWDFSSRWELKKNDNLTIKTSQYIPVDLNSILYQTEKILFKYTSKEKYKKNYENRKIGMNKFLKVCSNGRTVYYADYNYVTKALNTEYFYFSNLFYFFFVEPIEGNLLAFIKEMGIFTSQGIVASNNRLSSHQWDYVIWSIFQQLVVQYLHSIEKNEKDGLKVATNFIETVFSKYKINGTIYENYSPIVYGPSCKGEYKTSRGFAWTHSTILYLIYTYNTEDEFRGVFE